MTAELCWSNKHKMRRGAGRNPDGSYVQVMYCRECKGSGASLTKHCVVRQLTDAEEAEIAAGRLNFVNGEWVRK
jgi:hypothetical protein